MSKEKRLKIAILSLLVIIGLYLVWLIKPSYLLSIMIVLSPGAILNFFWLKNSKIKILIFSLTAALLFAPAVELMARLKNVWDVASIFPRPFNLIPYENMLFAFLNFFWGLSFYEYFSGDDKNQKINHRFKYLILLFVIFSTLIYGLYFISPQLIASNYFIIAIITIIIPEFLIFYFFPRLIKRIWLSTIFFALVFFSYEVLALYLNYWWWPGEYLITTKIFGYIFPLDDVIIWYFLSTPALIAGYKYFTSDLTE
jgi:hypothetical protein